MAAEMVGIAVFTRGDQVLVLCAHLTGMGFLSAKAVSVCFNGEHEKLMKHGWEVSRNFQYLRLVVQP